MNSVDALICTVRGCRLPLQREQNRVVCASGHSFDVARSGYLNLLQPQDRRSKQPGDAAVAVTARRRLHDSGATAAFVEAIADLLRPAGPLLDIGCGEGFYLNSIASRCGVPGAGVDLSLPAIEAAAKRYPDRRWVVANADRMAPWADASFEALMSITARLNADEFRRVLRAGGALLVAVPAPEDLIELRGEGRDRGERVIADCAGRFALHERQRVTTRAALDAEAVADLRKAIYRPRGESGAMTVTFSLDLLLFR